LTPDSVRHQIIQNFGTAGGVAAVAQLKADGAVGELAILRDSCSDEILKLSR
jgi:hypothetical protein